MNESTQPSFSFDALRGENPTVPPFEFYIARDNTELPYRKFASRQQSSNDAILLIHGSAWHSRQFFKMGPELSALGDVYALDLRGHGPKTETRGDVMYVGQLEDDLADFIQFLRSRRPNLRVTLLGHSSGGGLAIRLAGGTHNRLVDRFVLVSPYVSPTASVSRKNQKWSVVSVPKIIAISILNGFGIKRFNNRNVIRFNMPMELRDGTETLNYSYRMLTSINPRQKYKIDIDQIGQPALVLVGEKDEIFWPEKFGDFFGSRPNVKVRCIPNSTHLSMMTDLSVTEEIKSFFQTTSAY
jgi:non-heme chloroperoxidase